MQEYPWYETVSEKDELMQGDFIKECPVIIPPLEISDSMEVKVVEYNTIIMSQSCDLVQRKLDLVLVCPIWLLSEFEKRNDFFKSKKGKEALRQGNVPGYHLLNKCEIKEIEYVFQSRNPPHRIHQKIIEIYAPNLVYSFPYISVKPDDYSFNKRLQCYEYIKDKYNIKLLCTLLPRMLAGPREALQNMMLFKNYGFKYFIFGRGKNSVGNYYKDDDAYKFCKQYESKLGINIIYTGSQSIHEEVVRASDIKHMYIDKGLYPPEDIMDPKIADILLKENTDV